MLRSYYLLGVRYMTLTWSNSVPWADSSGDLDDPKIAHHEGLTPFGRDVVHEMNRLGMMVDISHVSDKTFWDVLATTHVPLIASHSSARAVTPAPRNLTDEMLRAVAKNGGVVMVNFFPGFIDEEYRKAFEALAPTLKTKVDAALEKFPERDPKARAREANRVTLALVAKLPRPPLKALIDHLDHIAKVAGIDHVGLGSDFDGIPSVPLGLDSAADLPHITQALVQRGYNREQIHKLLGGNLLRTFREVERARGKPAH